MKKNKNKKKNKHFKLFSIFFINLQILLAVCPSLYLLSQPEAFADITGGNSASFFAMNTQTTVDFMPTAAVLSFLAVSIYVVRRRMEGKGSLLVILGLFAYSIVLLEPIALRTRMATQPREANDASARTMDEPHSGLIQEREPNLKTVVLQGSAGLADPVVITADTSGRADGRALNVYSGREVSSFRSRPQGSPLDLQIAQKIEEPAFLRGFSQDIDAVHAIFFDAVSNSIGDYIWTGLAFFALAAAFFFLSVLTDWKLINFTIYAIAVRALYWLFPLLHGEAALGFLRRFLPRFLSDAAIAALPVILIVAALVALGLTLILPQYIRRNEGDIFL